ncbi:hypothetical protein Q6272_33935, partial [Klebsiella pneumoniae]|uniref:hypothetical protein n=1 Tax=Klebsiella pneumoniae TaxID=573 RepID=UPI002731B4C4
SSPPPRSPLEIYCWLEGRKGLKIKLPETVPPNVSASLAALIPAIITTTAIATGDLLLAGGAQGTEDQTA